jgi:phage terminase large subunit GpA-like protein
MEYLRAEHPGKIGFHVPSWLSRFVSLAKVMASFRRGLADRDALKDFLNKHAAEPWRVLVRESSADELLQGRGVLPRQVVPQEAVGITCGIDVQKYGFWFVVRAWANDFSSWLIDYGHLATWEDVETLLFDTRWPVDASGRTAGIWRAAVDTGGGEQDGSVSMTEETYFWLRRNGSGRGCRVWGTKGASRLLAGKLSVGKPLDKAPSGKPIQGGLQIVSLNTDALKDTVTYRLEQARSGGAMPAWLHQDTGDDYARQILAEAKQVDDKGVECWVQLRKDNHLLDCEVMCHALADPEWPGGGVNLLRPAGTPAPGRRVRSSGVRV